MSKIEFFFEDTDTKDIRFKSIDKYIKELIHNELYVVGNITVVFCSDDYLLSINKQYLNHDYYTDIITFDYTEKKKVSGDLFISIDRIKENSKELGVKEVKELYRVIFHGILHLIGYNDKSVNEKNIMTEKEDFYLNKVDFNIEGNDTVL